MHAQFLVSYWNEDFFLLDIDISSIVINERYACPFESHLIFIYSLYYRHLPLSIFIVYKKMRCLLEKTYTSRKERPPFGWPLPQQPHKSKANDNPNIKHNGLEQRCFNGQGAINRWLWSISIIEYFHFVCRIVIIKPFHLNYYKQSIKISKTFKNHSMTTWNKWIIGVWSGLVCRFAWECLMLV